MSPLVALDARKLGDYGIGTYVRELAHGLVGSAPDLELALIVRDLEAEELKGLRSAVTLLRDPSPGYSLRELVSVSRHLRRLRPDLFHALHYVLPLRLPCPAVVTIHDLIHLELPELLRGPLARLYARAMIASALRRARRVIAISGATASAIGRRFPAAAGRIDVVPNGVDELFRAPLAESELAARLRRLDLAPGYFLFVGNPKPHKNLERLVEAYGIARRSQPSLPPLVLAGARHGSETPLRQLSERLGLAEHVRVLPHLPYDDLPALYRGAELFVFPSLAEGFGLPVLEAMASGVPVVAARIPPLIEVTGEAALLVDPLNRDAIAQALLACHRDGALRARLAAAGRARAASFTWAETARQTAAVYRRALATPRLTEATA